VKAELLVDSSLKFRIRNSWFEKKIEIIVK